MRPEFIAANIAYCAIEDGRAIGFYVLAIESEGLRLDHLWVLPVAMGRGVGRALFEHAVEEARTLGFSSMNIEADPNAEGFYQRMGARRVGTSVTEIDSQSRELPLMSYRME
jgi:GNAT superfamily N-acetyltransferase